MPPSSTVVSAIHRVEVTTRQGHADPVAAGLVHDAAALGITLAAARATHVYLIAAPLTSAQISLVSAQLLADPVIESAVIGASAVAQGTQIIEVHSLPGVMDPVAQSVQLAVRELVGVESHVSTGWRYDLSGLSSSDADVLASRLLANPVIQKVHRTPWHPSSFPVGRSHDQQRRNIPLIHLSDDQLVKLSREAHLFLSLDEVQAVQAHYRKLGREPRDAELETLAQTWSEHCVHKTLKSTVVYRGADKHDPINWSNRPGHVVNPDGSVTIKNLLKSTVAAATHELIKEGIDWTLSVFVDNSGVIAFDDDTAVCIKVETHNHPSAIEPYGGAATGIGGCIRDVIGTGLGARPIASTDVFCVAFPGQWSTGVQNFNTEVAENTEKGKDKKDKDIPMPLSSHLSALSVTSALEILPFNDLPAGCLHPRRVLSQVVAGVRDYGNRMGIPTVSGGVYFDNRYVGNPLVYCGCIGVMPRNKIRGTVQRGDLIVALGGRTGRDGIHGATFSSAELEQSSADEFSHAVQIGNAIEEKRVLDAILRARDWDPTGLPLFSGLTDCGAGGFSSAVGEMGKDTGATVHLDRAPLKYAGLSYTEIWISEAQERMVLAVPPANLAALQGICDEESVELAVLGTFGPELSGSPETNPERKRVGDLETSPERKRVGGLETSPERKRVGGPLPHGRGSFSENAIAPSSNGSHTTHDPELVLFFHGQEVGRLSMHLLHEGIPMPTREAVWKRHEGTKGRRHEGKDAEQSIAPALSSLPSPSWLRGSVPSCLLSLLSHPNIASKHWIIRQYDHEVRGNTIIKPLVGPSGRGPSDASVVQPVPGSRRGLAVSQGLQTGIGDPDLADGGGDPYLMTIAAIDECVRNLVCVGADPSRIAILDNFCWPSCGKPENMGSLVRAAEGCYDAAKAYRTPFVSGKDSLNNQFTIPASAESPARTIEIPPTLLITGIGIVQDVNRCVTSDAKRPGSALLLVGPTDQLTMGGSHYTRMFGVPEGVSDALPRVDLALGPAAAKAVAFLIASGLVLAAHDVSDGGLLVAIAEMLIGGSTASTPIGAQLTAYSTDRSPLAHAFSEAPSRYLLEVSADAASLDQCKAALGSASCTIVGHLTATGRLVGPDDLDVAVEDLAQAWLTPLDW